MLWRQVRLRLCQAYLIRVTAKAVRWKVIKFYEESLGRVHAGNGLRRDWGIGEVGAGVGTGVMVSVKESKGASVGCILLTTHGEGGELLDTGNRLHATAWRFSVSKPLSLAARPYVSHMSTC